MHAALRLFLAGILLALLAATVQEPDADDRLAVVAQRLQADLDDHAEALHLKSSQLVKDLAHNGPASWMSSHAVALEKERHRDGTVYLGFLKDSLICWSGTPAFSPRRIASDTTAHLHLPDGIWIRRHTTMDGFRVDAIRPIWRTPPIENRFLSRGFHPSLRTPSGLIADTDPGVGHVLRNADGATFLRITWRDGALEVGQWLWIKLALVALAAAIILAALFQACMALVYQGSPWKGVLAFIASVAVLRTASLFWLPFASLGRTPLFDPAVYATSAAFGSMGDLLINALLIFLIAHFVRKALRHGATLPGGAITSLLLWTFLLAYAAWITRMLIGVVLDSSLELDLDRVQDLDGFSLLAVLSMAILLSAWVIMAANCIDVLGPGTSSRTFWATAAVALIGSTSIHLAYGISDVVLFLWPAPLLIILAHDDRNGLRFTHVVLVLGILSGLSAHLLNKYESLREHEEVQVLAERLATREDPVVEQLFRETAPVLRNDQGTYRLLAGVENCTPAELDQRVRQRFFGGYWERYEVRLFAFGTNGDLRCATDAEPPRSFSNLPDAFADPMAAFDTPDLFIEEQEGRSPYYHGRISVMPGDDLPPVQLIVELVPRSAPQGLGFPALLLAGDDPLANKATRYTFARYENGLLVEQGRGHEHPLFWQGNLDENGRQWYTDERMQYLAHGDTQGTVVVLGSGRRGFMERATSFSYLFACYSILLALAMAWRTILNARGIPALGIGGKVRLALVLFTLAGSVFFGIGTRRLLERQYEERFDAAVLEKARSVHQELQQRMDGEPVLDPSHTPYLDHLLGRMSNVFFTDITLYTLQGRVLSTSRPQIFATGLLGRRMDPLAYERVALAGTSAFVHEEAIGTATYRAAYMPLRDRRGQVLAYIALPGFADQALREKERAAVLVAVVNLFVLLFALSVLVAVFISNWTTRPLDLLKNALARVGLQGTNEPIRYRGDDEIGQLVEVYNRKVEELRESAERLARSERESAWREMARQVAHEIKNPLTPMKLSIQHFQRTWTPEAPDAAARLERFSTGMVEQIDTLSGIAGAFSNFAQMPRAKAEDLDLAEVAEAAMSVFRATPGVTCKLERSSEGPLPVHADREQLMRVFNNLLKNAVQSIPDGREGQVRVVLRHAIGEAIAEVHDNGSGITETDKERIFRPNFTTKSSGMGLGLAMVQRMVENAGGRVWFETEEGEGSTFFVALPLRKA